MLIDTPPTLLNAIIYKKHLSHFMAKNMNELAHKSPLILNLSVTCWLAVGRLSVTCRSTDGRQLADRFCWGALLHNYPDS